MGATQEQKNIILYAAMGGVVGLVVGAGLGWSRRRK